MKTLFQISIKCSYKIYFEEKLCELFHEALLCETFDKGDLREAKFIKDLIQSENANIKTSNEYFTF